MRQLGHARMNCVDGVFKTRGVILLMVRAERIKVGLDHPVV